jgi:O-methyltransferase domain
MHFIASSALSPVPVVFREMPDGRFEQTALSECLRSGVPSSMRAWARLLGTDWHHRFITEMLHSVRTGEAIVERALGLPLWEYFAQHPEKAELCNESMTNFSNTETAAIMDNYDFSSTRMLVDVGGGLGTLLGAILNRYLDVRGILSDLPSVIDSAHREAERHGLANRCRFVGIDFFASVPVGGDTYILKHVIHDWNDERAAQILRNCHAVMLPGAKLLVIEAVIVPGNEPSLGKVLDLQMLLIGGKERTEQEFRALFQATGFELTRIVPTASPVAIVEGVRN